MPKAYVLISADRGAEEILVHKLRSTQNVKEAYCVYGAYDVVTTIDAPTMEELKQMIALKVQALPEVKSTLSRLSRLD